MFKSLSSPKTNLLQITGKKINLPQFYFILFFASYTATRLRNIDDKIDQSFGSEIIKV